MAKLLLIDDDPELSEILIEQLVEMDHEVVWLDEAESALNTLSEKVAFDVALLDNKMPGMSGIELLTVLKEKGISIPIILMTSAHNDQTVIEAINAGATDYLIKPIDYDEFPNLLQPALELALQVSTSPKPVIIQNASPPEEDNSRIIGKSRPILEVLKNIGRLAEMDETVLILGETGTGKELIARAIHTNSQRKTKPYVVMNCTALNENLLDDELFGHEAGAYTGAEKLRKGRFEHADEGTLFLDEVGDMPLPLQAKLLRVLENHEVVRIGSNDPIKINVRVLTATHQDLKHQVIDGAFRQDLYYRLEGMTIHLPPLRKRTEDIELLARHFLKRLWDDLNPQSFHQETVKLLREYHWPGNIRQLQKVICRAVANCRGSQILPQDIDFGELPSPETSTESSDEAIAMILRRAIEKTWSQESDNILPCLQEHLEKELIRFGLEHSKLSQVQLAKKIGMARNTLRARIEQFKLSSSDSD